MFRTFFYEILAAASVEVRLASYGIYTVSQKKETLYSCPYLRLILTDFRNSFTDTFSRKFAIKLLIEIPSHLKCVATLPCEMLKAEN